MPRPRKTLEETVAQARLKHGNKYKYISLDYSSGKGRLTSECPTHGVFEQNRDSHIKGQGCPKCARDLGAWTLESLTAKMAEIFGDRYTYSNLTRTPIGPRVDVTCPDHGTYNSLVGNLLAKKGCNQCSIVDSRLSEAVFLEKAGKVFGEMYRYENYGYDFKKKAMCVDMVCPDHGATRKTANAVLMGNGCYECGKISIGMQNSFTEEEIFEKFADSEYPVVRIESRNIGRSNRTFIVSRCEKHGEFAQEPFNKEKGQRCIKCAGKDRGERQLDTIEEAIAKARETHGDKYEYDGYTESDDYIRLRVICKDHGLFTPIKASHIAGNGCASCFSKSSGAGDEFAEFVKTVFDDTETEVMLSKTSRKKWDAYSPSAKLAFEYHGLFWHSDDRKPVRYHLDKHKEAEAVGVRTIHIFEHEWQQRREVVEDYIKSLKHSQSIMARKCKVLEVSASEASSFHNKNHIQGSVGATKHYGLRLDGRLVCVASISLKQTGRGQARSAEHAELVRFSGLSGHRVQGGLSKLLDHAQKVLGYKALTTFSDIRMFSGGAYKACGFGEIRRTQPNYFYILGSTYVSKEKLQKSRLAKQGVDVSGKTESQLAKEMGYNRVYDCGKIVWQKTY